MANKSLHTDRYPRQKTAHAPAGELPRYMPNLKEEFI